MNAGLLVVLETLLTLLAASPKERAKKKHLGQIRRRLAAQSPPHYGSFSHRILPHFAASVLRLYRYLQPLLPLFERTIHNRDPEAARKYREYLVQTRLPQELRDLRVDFTYEVMKEELLLAPDKETALQRIEKSFRTYLQALSEPQFAGNDDLFDNLERLADLAEYDFTSLLAKFDPAAELKNRACMPRFASVPADRVLPELLDLYFVLAPVEITNGGMQEIICALLSRLDRASEANNRNLATLLRRLQQFTSQALSKDILKDLIRCAKAEADFEPDADRKLHHYVAAYMSNLTERYEHNKQRCVQEVIKESLAKSFTALFGEVDLLDVRGYNDTESRGLVSLGLEGFSHVDSLRVLKSYLLSKYRSVQPALGALESEGLFQSSQFKAEYLQAYSGCGKILESIERLEADACGIGSLSVIALHELLDRQRTGERVAMEIARITNTLNERAKRIVDEATASFRKLKDVLGDLLDDHKASEPTYILNIRVIGGGMHRDFVTAFGRGYKEAATLVRILRNLTVLGRRSIVRGELSRTHPSSA